MMESVLNKSFIEKIQYVFEDAGKLILFYLASIFMITQMLFVCNVSITRFHLPVVSVIVVGLYYIYAKKQQKCINHIMSVIGICILAVICSIFVSSIFYDTSYDGRNYHQNAMIALVEGWNPIKNPKIDGLSIWGETYAKITWVIGSVIYKCVGVLETVKAENFIFMSGIFFYSTGLLLSFTKKKVVAVVVGVLLVINPIMIAQVLTSYVDGILGIVISYMLLTFYKMVVNESYLNNWRENKSDYLVIFSTVLIASNIKFTGAGYSFVICLTYFLFVLIKRKSVKKVMQLFGYFTAIFSISMILFGFNPYITNIIEYKHPLYPLAGSDKIDIMTPNTPVNLREMNRWKKALYSNFSLLNTYTNEAVLLWDNSVEENLNLVKNDKLALVSCDARVAGFGYFTSIYVVYLLISSIYLFTTKTNKYRLAYRVISVGVLLTILINSEFWWARYIPQVWLLMCLNTYLLLTKEYKKLSNIRKIFPVTIIVLGFVFFILQASAILRYNIESKRAINASINYVKSIYGDDVVDIVIYNDFTSSETFLREKGVNVNVVTGIDGVQGSFYGLDTTFAELE